MSLQPPACEQLGTPPAELTIDVVLVRRLLTEQCPELATLPIRPVDTGWDNAIFRLGDRYAVRLPRRQVAAKLIEHEQTWLPQLAERLPLSVPTPLFEGLSNHNYPWRWSIFPWLPGFTIDLEPLDASQAIVFASFLHSLHVPAPPHAPSNPVRGVPLASRAEIVEQRLGRLSKVTNAISPQVLQAWHTAVAAPIDVEPTWIHGDLHPRNVLASNGQLSGIIDWGDMTSGDRATDLAAFWMLFTDRDLRQQAIATYSRLSAVAISNATLHRAKGWAVHFGTVLLETGRVDNPRHAAMGEQILNCIASDLE